MSNDTIVDTSTKTDLDSRSKLKSWLGHTFKILITDGREIVGGFVCTDRDANVILEYAWEYAQASDNIKQEPRSLGLALVPGHHIKSISLMMNP